MLYGVQEQFADTLLINGVSVGELLAADADRAVIVDRGPRVQLPQYLRRLS